jgi:hypothetical protein
MQVRKNRLQCTGTGRTVSGMIGWGPSARVNDQSTYMDRETKSHRDDRENIVAHRFEGESRHRWRWLMRLWG